MDEFRLQKHVLSLYAHQPRQLAFQAGSVEEFKAWQQTLRETIRAQLGIAGRIPPVAPAAERLDSVDRGDYLEEKYALDVGEAVRAPMYLLIPKRAPPYRTVLAFHGHGPGVQPILGNYRDAQSAEADRAIDGNFAQAFAQAGYLVCAVEQRGFGERITDQLGGDTHEDSCRHLAFEYLMQGRTLIGERCWDGMVALSYLQRRADVIEGCFGCTGLSGGATTTLWLSALDERISVVVPACYFCSFRASILSMYHCECNYVPGILEYVEMGDLAALLAPRPVRFINGARDEIYPLAGATEQIVTVQAAYHLLGVPERCSLEVHPGSHQYSRALSQEWFARWLCAPNAG